jgi:hypothetical protein
MATLFQILGVIVGIGSLVCLIMVLIKLFKEKGVLHLILGIICALYPFIWGWMNVTRLNIKNIMLAWSGCIVVQIIFNVIAGAAAQ